MSDGKAIFELYNYLKTTHEPYRAKHIVSAIVLCLLEDLEQSGEKITPELIEAALKAELDGYNLPSKEKKVS